LILKPNEDPSIIRQIAVIIHILFFNSQLSLLQRSIFNEGMGAMLNVVIGLDKFFFAIDKGKRKISSAKLGFLFKCLRKEQDDKMTRRQ